MFHFQDKDPFIDDPNADYHIGSVKLWMKSVAYMVSTMAEILWHIWYCRVRLMVFNATFNNISVISWWSVLLVEETGENHQPVASH